MIERDIDADLLTEDDRTASGRGTILVRDDRSARRAGAPDVSGVPPSGS
jgi:hypothetical protein